MGKLIEARSIRGGVSGGKGQSWVIELGETNGKRRRTSGMGPQVNVEGSGQPGEWERKESGGSCPKSHEQSVTRKRE